MLDLRTLEVGDIIRGPSGRKRIVIEITASVILAKLLNASDITSLQLRYGQVRHEWDLVEKAEKYDFIG